MVNLEDMERMLVEIMTHREPRIPDTQEMANVRAQLQIECDEIVASGLDVDIPHEIPGL